MYILPAFKIIRCFSFSRYIVFTININIVYIQVHNKSYMSGTNTRVPEEEELMTINIDSSEQSRARLQLQSTPQHASSASSGL